MTLRSPTDFDLAGTRDPQLYAFMVQRLALAIRRADSNLGPGAVGWGATQITDLTANRSLEAHLADHGIHLDYGKGSPAQDPEGPLHTIDPDVHVLRVDKYLAGSGAGRDVVDVRRPRHGQQVPVQRLQRGPPRRRHAAVENAIRRSAKVPPARTS